MEKAELEGGRSKIDPTYEQLTEVAARDVQRTKIILNDIAESKAYGTHAAAKAKQLLSKDELTACWRTSSRCLHFSGLAAYNGIQCLTQICDDVSRRFQSD